MIGLIGHTEYSMSAAMKLSPTETELIGRWEIVNGLVRADATGERIEWLTTNCLEKITASKDSGEWDTLFGDPDDGHHRERNYGQGSSREHAARRRLIINGIDL